MSKPSFELHEGETILRSEAAVLMAVKLSGNMGRLYLTNERIIFERNISFLFGLIGYLIQSLRQKVVFEMPLSSLEKVQRIKIVRNDMILELTPTGGDPVKIALSKTIDEWIADIQANK